MQDILGKVAYLKGYAEGLKYDESTPEGKILLGILDILDDMASQIDDLFEAQAIAQDETDDLQETLFDLIEVLSMMDDEDFEDEDFEEDDLYEVVCPRCGDHYLSDFESFEEDDVVCPTCGEPFKLDDSVLEKLSEHSHECSCGHDHCDHEDHGE